MIRQSSRNHPTVFRREIPNEQEMTTDRHASCSCQFSDSKKNNIKERIPDKRSLGDQMKREERS
ncbi:hypothetical protein D922_00183 [Enterococcus faecalis 06-MB-DW-09]|nr:hypothetical protein D922_00183 [Enterococcus faecalis 06-MB-DW-09]